MKTYKRRPDAAAARSTRLLRSDPGPFHASRSRPDMAAGAGTRITRRETEAVQSKHGNWWSERFQLTKKSHSKAIGRRLRIQELSGGRQAYYRFTSRFDYWEMIGVTKCTSCPRKNRTSWSAIGTRT